MPDSHTTGFVPSLVAANGCRVPVIPRGTTELMQSLSNCSTAKKRQACRNETRRPFFEDVRQGIRHVVGSAVVSAPHNEDVSQIALLVFVAQDRASLYTIIFVRPSNFRWKCGDKCLIHVPHSSSICHWPPSPSTLNLPSPSPPLLLLDDDHPRQILGDERGGLYIHGGQRRLQVRRHGPSQGADGQVLRRRSHGVPRHPATLGGAGQGGTRRAAGQSNSHYRRIWLNLGFRSSRYIADVRQPL